MVIPVSLVSIMALGLLMEGEKHGYELLKEMKERGLLRWTRVSKVAVYKSLDRLEREGCLSSWTEKEGGAPEKRVYAVTAQGEERLRDMVYALCASRDPLRFETSVGLAFIKYLDREEILDALERRLHYINAQVETLKREKDIMEGLSDDIFLEILRHELAVYGEEARWLSRIIQGMETG